MNYRKLMSNMAVAFSAQGVSLLASLAMSLVVPKLLGISQFGYWQLFVFYTSYSGFFHLGLNDGVYLIEGGNSRSTIDKKTLNSQFLIGSLWQMAIGIIITGAAFFITAQPERIFVLIAFSIYTILFNIQSYLGYVFQAMNETKLFSFASMLERTSFLVALLVLFLLGADDFRVYVILYITSKVLSLIYSLSHSADILTAGVYSLSESVWQAIESIKVGFGLMIANVADMLVLGVARAMVDNAWGIEVFGKVSFSLSMVNFFITFVSQASMVLFPALRQGSESERRSFYRGIRDAMEIAFPALYLLYFPMATALSLWLPQYANSMRYFALLLPVCVFNTKMDVCCTTYFKVLREERLLLKVNLITVLGSATLSAFGVYALGSLDCVLAGTVICILVRSLWSERHLDTKMGVDSTAVPIEEALLTGVFVLLALLMPSQVAFLGYFFTYVVYLVINRTFLDSLSTRVKSVFHN